MKKVLIYLFALLPAIAMAENFQGMNQADMQKMMVQMQKMQSCLSKVYQQNDFQKLESRQQQFENEVTALCQKGQRDKAQKKAIAFSEEMNNSPVFKEIKKCGELAKDFSDEPIVEDDFDPTKEHVCDINFSDDEE